MTGKLADTSPQFLLLFCFLIKRHEKELCHHFPLAVYLLHSETFRFPSSPADDHSERRVTSHKLSMV